MGSEDGKAWSSFLEMILYQFSRTPLSKIRKGNQTYGDPDWKLLRGGRWISRR